MERLLPALEGLPPAYLVGGAVRDLLRGESPADLDVAIEGDGRSVARAVGDWLGGEVREYERFGTADVVLPDHTFHFATTREVRSTTLRANCRKWGRPRSARTFGATSRSTPWRSGSRATTSGISTTRSGASAGPRRRPDPGAARPSFLDDPTRLLRAVRYATRLDFALEQETERLAREAVAADALSTVSGKRIQADLMAPWPSTTSAARSSACASRDPQRAPPRAGPRS